MTPFQNMMKDENKQLNFYNHIKATICYIRTWVNWRNITLTCCLRPPFPCPFQYWPRSWTIPLKNHYKTTLEERKTGIRAVWPKLSVLDCSLSHRCSLTISEWNCFLYLHELGRGKHRYPARRGFSPACLYGFIKEVVRVACLSRTYFVYAQGEM